MIKLGNAPVSYGVFGLSRPDVVPLPSGEELLRLVREAGYDGIDLGAPGLLGRGQQLAENLSAHGLELCGGWLDFPFTGTQEQFDAALAAARPVLDDFGLVAGQQTGPGPLPTIADSGDAQRKASPGGGSGLELDPDRWAVFVRRLEEVMAEVRDRGLEPTFHHHAVTYVETPREIDRLLEDTDIGLTFDTGHLILGGGDPLGDMRRWGSRINHLHLKDVDLQVLVRARGSDDMVRDVWEKRVFVALGQGDLALAELMDEIIDGDFSGWLVVEQDVVLLDAADVDRAIADQRANREVLGRWFA